MRWQARLGSQIGVADDPHEIGIADFSRGDQRQGLAFGAGLAMRPCRCFRRRVLEADIDLAADERLYAFFRRLVGEFQGAEQIVGVRHRDRRRSRRDRMADDLRNLQRAFE
jgi:hypothetical protein